MLMPFNQTIAALYQSGTDAMDLWLGDDVRTVIKALCAIEGPDRELARLHAALFESRLALRSDRLIDAMSHLATARGLARSSADALARVAIAVMACRVHLDAPTQADGIAELEHTWPLATSLGDARLAATCAWLLGTCFQAIRQWEAGEHWMGEAIKQAMSGGLHVLVLEVRMRNAAGHNARGDELRQQGRLDEAQAAYLRAVLEHDAVRSAPGWAELSLHTQLSMIIDRALACKSLGRTQEALGELDKCLERAGTEVDAEMFCNVQMGRAAAFVDLTRLEDAAQACESGLAAALQKNILRCVPELHAIRAEVAEKQGDLVAALRHLRQVIRARDEHAIDQARVNAAAAAVRLDTQRALNEAAAERERANALAREASSDPLTGLANVRRFHTQMALAFDQSQSAKLPLCAAMLDIDHFKRVNDTYGHGTGDCVLQRIARVLEAQSRSGDLVARLGGEEFAILFDQLDLAHAWVVAERIRSAVQSAPWTEIVAGLAVTISVGVGNLSDWSSPKVGLAAIDKALYEAKHRGRNRVCAAAASDVGFGW